MLTQMHNWHVTESESGAKLSAFIQQKLEQKPSLKSIKRALESNRCLINGSIERFASTPLNLGDSIALLPFVDQRRHSGIEKDRILYEDESLLVYNKPPGLSCEPSGIRALLPDYTPVHRLDRDTTGILILAKSKEAYQTIGSQFRNRTVQKEYLALVDGVPKEKQGTVENYLGKKGWFQGQTIWGKVNEDQGHLATTNWKLESVGKSAALIRCFPLTGRTHQLRVHLQSLGHPILGDAQYARRFNCPFLPSRVMLHANKIKFIHPTTHKKLSFVAPLPPDFLYASEHAGIKMELSHALSHC